MSICPCISSTVNVFYFIRKYIFPFILFLTSQFFPYASSLPSSPSFFHLFLAIPYKALLRESDNRKKHLRVSWVHSINAANSGKLS